MEAREGREAGRERTYLVLGMPPALMLDRLLVKVDHGRALVREETPAVSTVF